MIDSIRVFIFSTCFSFISDKNFGNIGVLAIALEYNAEYLHHLVLTQSRLQLQNQTEELKQDVQNALFSYQCFSDDQPEYSKDFNFEKATVMYNMACPNLGSGPESPQHDPAAIKTQHKPLSSDAPSCLVEARQKISSAHRY